jgi:competence protein ComEA
MSRYWAALVVLILALSACQQSPPPIVVVPPPTAEAAAAPTPAPIRVYVSGAVNKPGVKMLPPHSIGDDAIQAAGGPTLDADLDHVNLAHELSDQEHFHVPRKNELTGGTTPGALPASKSRININTATVQELDLLPKVGPATAQLIVDYRNRNGPFKNIEDIMQVKGIGQALFDQIKGMITIGD